jgi:prepilin-type N-terminal cleavage/methylation domain-containing protein
VLSRDYESSEEWENEVRKLEKTRQRGFSLIEAMIVVTISLVLAAYAVTNISTGVANMRLRAAASDFSSLAQRARISAVQNNGQGNTSHVYTINFGLPSGNGAYVDLNLNGSYDSALSPAIENQTSEPLVQFGGTVNQVAAPGGTGGKPTNLDAAGGPLGWTATSGNVSFNSRGLPCSLSGGVCTTNVNFVFYFSDTRAGGSQWAAVSITAAGHPKTWWWNGSSWIN